MSKLYRIEIECLVVRASGNIEAYKEAKKLIEQGKVKMLDLTEARDLYGVHGFKASNERED